MKKVTIILIAFSFLYCEAQTPVIDRYDNTNYREIPNAYYKDINNFQNLFVGTWLYVNGTTSLKVKFRKREMIYSMNGNIPDYEDWLVGEYQYIENGVEKVNTLANLTTNYASMSQHKLFSITKIGLDFYPKCDECPAGTERMLMNFDEPANDDIGLRAHFAMRRVVENGVEKIKVQFVKISAAIDANKLDYNAPSTFRNFTLPYGNYTLIKQP